MLVYESGTIGAKPDRLPLSIGDGILAETADAVVSVPEVFNYWLQPGRIDVGFLGAAQIDRFANINTTVIGDYAHPEGAAAGRGRRAGDRRRLRGGDRGRAPERRGVRGAGGLRHLGRVRARPGRPGAARPARPRAGPRSSPTSAILEPDPETRELVLTSRAPGRDRRAGARGDRLGAGRRAELGRTEPGRPRRSWTRCAAWRRAT